MLRVSVREVLRRRSAGTLGMEPIDRGRQLLFAQADVLRVVSGARTAPAAATEKPRVSVDAIRRRQEDSRMRSGRKPLREPAEGPR